MRNNGMMHTEGPSIKNKEISYVVDAVTNMYER
jgi:hypothetical protein